MFMRVLNFAGPYTLLLCASPNAINTTLYFTLIVARHRLLRSSDPRIVRQMLRAVQRSL
jgi:hypothetical protein